MAKTAPYWLATGTLPMLATGTFSKMAASVKFTDPIVVPLCLSVSGATRRFFPDNDRLSRTFRIRIIFDLRDKFVFYEKIFILYLMIKDYDFKLH
jgi:hypothetical protein